MASKFDSIINKYWPAEADRRIARAFVEKFADVPGMEDRIPSMLQEAASTADKIAGGKLSLDDGRSYLASFAADGLGLAPHIIAPLAEWFDSPGLDGAATETQQQPPDQAKPAQAAPAAATIRPATAVPDREAARLQVEKFETAMRAPQGTEQWSSYWRNPQAQADYRAALDTIHGASEPSFAPGTLAEDAAEVRAAIAGTAPPAAAAEPSAPA
jgi:hypothetical protein